MPDSGALALDDADTVASEPLLLHLLNTARDRGLRVLLSGRTRAVALAGSPARPVQPTAGHHRGGNPATE